MIKSKPAALPLYYVSTHSLMAVVVLTVEVTLPATPPAVSSGKSATLRLPLSIINGGVLPLNSRGINGKRTEHQIGRGGSL